MEQLIDIIEKFLYYSDDKLAELSEKNLALRQEESEESEK
ncbi:SP_0009 family protein [Streptococcus pluranimalium]